MSTAPREMTLKEALQLSDEAIDNLHTELAKWAFEHPPFHESSEYVSALLQRRTANKAARTRARLALLEMLSRDFSITVDTSESG
jgi:hypothetical protein